MSDMSDCRKPLLLASAAFIPLLFAFPAAAQTADAPAAAPQTTAGGAPEMEEITVTATRRSEALSKVTESVSAFSAAKMDILNVKSFADLAKFTPGVDFDPDSNEISIRGI